MNSRVLIVRRFNRWEALRDGHVVASAAVLHVLETWVRWCGGYTPSYAPDLDMAYDASNGAL